jgi:hypothetical protein
VSAVPSREGLLGLHQKRPLYSRLPALYVLTPPWVRSAARGLFASSQGRREALVERYLGCLASLPDGDGRPVPLLLTHDVDTPPGYAALPRLLEVEEAVGMASLTFVVTHRYRWEPGRLRAWQGRGHAFAVHDTLHDNRLAYLPPAAVEARVAEAQAALGPLDAGAFRAPAFLRTPALYEGLARRVRYDFSTNDAALVWPFPGDGIGTPFPVRHRGMVCVPTTLPRDGELIALDLGPAESVELWRRKATQLHRVGAPAVILTHPDPTFTASAERIGAYADFLDWAKRSGLFDLAPPAACLPELARRATAEVEA